MLNKHLGALCISFPTQLVASSTIFFGGGGGGGGYRSVYCATINVL